MHGDEKSDPFIVAGKPANGDGRPEPERVERRGGAEENTGQTSTRRTPSRASVSLGLDRVRTAARLDGKERCTALLHHVDAGLLRRAYFLLKRGAAAGVDGITWQGIVNLSRGGIFLLWAARRSGEQTKMMRLLRLDRNLLAMMAVRGRNLTGYANRKSQLGLK